MVTFQYFDQTAFNTFNIKPLYLQMRAALSATRPKQKFTTCAHKVGWRSEKECVSVETIFQLQ